MSDTQAFTAEIGDESSGEDDPGGYPTYRSRSSGRESGAGQRQAIDRAGAIMSVERVIRRNAFHPPGEALTDLLASLAEYQPIPAWPRNCRALADALVDTEPFTAFLAPLGWG